MLRKSPLFACPRQEKDAKEGYKGIFVLLEPITEGLPQDDSTMHWAWRQKVIKDWGAFGLRNSAGPLLIELMALSLSKGSTKSRP